MRSKQAATRRWPVFKPSIGVAAVLPALLLLAAGCRPAEPPPSSSQGGPSGNADAPGDVQAEFRRLCRDLEASADPFYGRARLAELEKRATRGTADPRAEASLEALLGRELLKLGRTSESIEHLERATALGADAGMDPRLLLDMKVYLGLAYLQDAEDANCLASHTAASCLYPVSSEGVHRIRDNTRAAGDVFAAIVDEFPNAVQSLWLLNLARMLSGDYPEGVPARYRLPPAALEAGTPFIRWWDRAPTLETAVVDLAGGALMDDFDGDGLLDLVTSTWDPCGSLKAFRNDGRGGFEDVTRAWELNRQLGGLNLVHADYDGDGRLDLLVLRGAWMGPLGRIRNSLLRNVAGESGPRFEDVTREAGLAEPAYPTQTAAWADYDLDGDLDLYVGNEDPDGGSYPSQLFRNDGATGFTDVSAETGTANYRFAKAVTWGDYDDDGDPDLYVSNIGPNRLYRNDGESFTDVAPELGLTEPAGRSFASWFFDFDNDGDLDLFVADYESPVPAVAAFYFGSVVVDNRPRVYRNDSTSDGARFTEIGTQVGLARPMLPMGANYGDLDNDGWLDFYLGTGEPGYETVMPNVMFRNERGSRFSDVTFAGGFGHLQKGHGVAFGDLDNDGDQDLLHQLGGFFPGDSYANALFENPGGKNAWITLRLAGRGPNVFGVGARIEVVVENGGRERSIHLLAGSGGTFGGSSFQQEIGLGRAKRIREVRIRWPGDPEIQVFRDVEVNRIYRAAQGASKLEPVKLPSIRLGAKG